MFRNFLCMAAIAVLLASAGKVEASVSLTIQGDNPQGPANFIPFGDGTTFGPFQGFIYRNIPAFDLGVGDILAFDLGRPNDVPISMNIALAQTTSNGSIQQDSNGFTTIVSNGTATSPFGNAIRFDYELGFVVDTPFTFSGGGLIIRFNATGDFAGDNRGNQVLVFSDADDPSGYFVQRFYGDADGEYPYDGSDGGTIGNFRLELSSSVVPEPTSLIVWGLLGAVGLKRRRRS